MDARKKLEWTSDQIARFWDYRAGQSDIQESYFALQVGEGVANLAEHVQPLNGLQVLDFGSGPGHLIPHLLDRGAVVSATDYSPNSVDEVVERFSRHRNWGSANVFNGGRIPCDDDSYDAAFCLETIEHLHTADCARIFDELLRVVRPGGFVVYTTPNEEDLSKHNVYCPNCNCEFHRMQHLRSWSASELIERLRAHGYEVPYCQGIDFRNFQPPTERHWRFSTIRRRAKDLLLQKLDQVIPRTFPEQRLLQRTVKKRHRINLAAIARKPATASDSKKTIAA